MSQVFVENSQNEVTPIFVLSLPRSGSTLLQRILGAHTEIATCSEPWLLLPIFYALKKNGVYAEYEHRGVAHALSDLCNILPNGRQDYLDSVNDFASSVYLKLTKNNEKYFLDKTPRYHLIAEEIFEAFPNAKVVFIWRNPLSIISSINRTWGKGHWKIYNYKVDIYKGISNLVNTYKKYKERSYAIRYEDLIKNPEDVVTNLCQYLDVPYDKVMLNLTGKVALNGTLGDPTGVKIYDEVSQDSLLKWKNDFSNPIRRRWAFNYLQWLGHDRLKIMGYKYDEIYNDLRATKIDHSYLFSDLIRFLYGVIYTYIEPAIIREKMTKMSKRLRYIVAHR